MIRFFKNQYMKWIRVIYPDAFQHNIVTQGYDSIDVFEYLKSNSHGVFIKI